jgi:hypothetical protein
LYIECWHAKDAGAALTAKFGRLDYYKANNLSYFEVSADDLKNLDSVLPKTLLKHGLIVF